MQTTSGFTSSSQRVTAGMRMIIEFTFQVAINISLGGELLRNQEPADQRTAPRDIVSLNMFVYGMSAIAADSQPIKHRNPKRRDKVSVRCAAHLRFAEFEIQLRRDGPRLFKQL